MCPSLVFGHHLWSTFFGSNRHVDKYGCHATRLSFCSNTRWRGRKLNLTPWAFCLQGIGRGSFVAATHPCCRVLPPSRTHCPPSTARTNLPPPATGVRRRHRRLRRGATARHMFTRPPTIQSTDEHPINQSRKQAIHLPIDYQEKKS